MGWTPVFITTKSPLGKDFNSSGVRSGRSIICRDLEPGKFIAVLDMKAEARNCLRVFFTFEDSRKVMATTQWWQRYLGFYEIPVGTHLLLHYRENSRKEVYLDEVERL